MVIVIRYRHCLVFISRSSDLIQYGGIVTKANCSAVKAIDSHKSHHTTYCWRQEGLQPKLLRASAKDRPNLQTEQ